MADIREDKSEILHYDNPEFKVFFRNNFIPANVKLYNLSIHWHDEVEFIYVTEGYTNYKLNDKAVRIQKGEGIFVNARQLHLLIPGNEDCQLLCLIFHPLYLSAGEYFYNKFILPVVENQEIPYQLLTVKCDWQKKILDEIVWMENYQFENMNEIKTMEGLYCIWNELYQHIGVEKSMEYKENSDLGMIKKMISFIHNNYMNDITLEEICREGNVGKTKCTQMFKAFLNLTPLDYVKNYRIDMGVRLLRETSLTITQVSGEVEFLDVSYFTRCFRKQVGMTPGQYRRSIKNEK